MRLCERIEEDIADKWMKFLAMQLIWERHPGNLEAKNMVLPKLVVWT